MLGKKPIAFFDLDKARFGHFKGTIPKPDGLVSVEIMEPNCSSATIIENVNPKSILTIPPIASKSKYAEIKFLLGGENKTKAKFACEYFENGGIVSEVLAREREMSDQLNMRTAVMRTKEMEISRGRKEILKSSTEDKKMMDEASPQSQFPYSNRFRRTTQY